MNLTDYTHLLNKPDSISDKNADVLGNVIAEFPYFQSARVLRLKHLYNQDSYKYNYALKVCAAYTTDRSMLFDFITSDNFVAVQKGLYEKKLEELMNMHVVGSEILTTEPSVIQLSNTLEDSIKNSIKEATTTEEEIVEKKLAIGKPLEFRKEEKHSFQEWLQLARFKPITREVEKSILEIDSVQKQKKMDLIDKFIENNPKLPQISKDNQVVPIQQKEEDTSYLMTETLARVYLEQKKYQKAIQAYEILILKYPEKSVFFANRISDIKILQQNNNL